MSILDRRPQLCALAERCGILPRYQGVDGHFYDTREPTYVALLGAMGLDGSTEEASQRALEAMARMERCRIVESVRVLRRGDPGLETLRLRMPSARDGKLHFHIELHPEDGEPSMLWEGELEAGSEVVVSLPGAAQLPLGYHALHVRLRGGGHEHDAHQTLAVAPTSAFSVDALLGGRRVYGLWTHLYALRDGQQRGLGDLGTLRPTIEWCGREGAAFLGLNPLHALLEPVTTLNPYFPSSRLYRAEVYLNLAAIPEVEACPAARSLLSDEDERRTWTALEGRDRVDVRDIAGRKRRVIDALHRCFLERLRSQPDHPRARAYRTYMENEGDALRNYATFVALKTHLIATQGDQARDPRNWPSDLASPTAAGVEAFRATHDEAIALQCFIQFELDRQLGHAAEACREAGLSIGLYEDIALGNAPDGADVWAFGPLFAHGASVGAPPDAFASQGQDWGLAPLVPARMAQEGFRYFQRLARCAMRHAGALRIDHVMGLRRQFWVPWGMTPADGAYVAYPESDLMGILALESHRARCLLIGEDLGTVPEGMHEALVAQGFLRSQVLYFERDHDGFFHPPGAYSNRALVTANTHDLPTLAGYWEGSDLERRRATGALVDDAALAQARHERGWARRRILERLAAEGLSPADERYEALCEAVYALLARTPAPLLGVAVDDLAGELLELNIPGSPDPDGNNWSRRMQRTLGELADTPHIQRILDRVRRERG